jgi:transcriptional regulator with GAF, ATPase, and Fis domain
MNESIHGDRTASEPQDRVAELIEQQTAISDVLRAIANSPHDLQPIFDAILDSATRLCRADTGSLRLSEEGGLRRVAVRGDPLFVDQAWSSFPVLAEKGSLLSRIATSRLPTHIPDLTAVERDLWDDLTITAVNLGFRTALIVPLLKGNEIVGTITLCSRSPTNRFPYSGTSLRKPPLPWRSLVASGNIARCRASWRMPTASLPWASSPPRLLMKSSSPLRRHATTPVRL